MTKSLFDAVVGQPPPSTVDVAAIIRRRRWVRMARRLTVILAPAAVAGVATVTALLPLASGTGAPDHPPQAPAAMATSPGPELTAQRVREALAEAVAALAPDARWLPDGEAPVLGPPAPPTTDGTVIMACDAIRCTVGGPSEDLIVDTAFSGYAELQRGSNIGLVMVGLHTTRHWLDCSATLQDGDCTVGSSPHGYAMVTRSIRPSALPNGMTGPVPVTTRTVAIELPGDRVLEISVNAPKDPNDARDTVLTETDLVSIADHIAYRLIG